MFLRKGLVGNADRVAMQKVRRTRFRLSKFGDLRADAAHNLLVALRVAADAVEAHTAQGKEADLAHLDLELDVLCWVRHGHQEGVVHDHRKLVVPEHDTRDGVHNRVGRFV